MTLKKVSDLARKFKIKLGQSHLKGDPLDFEGAKEELGAITDVSEYGRHPKPAGKAPSTGPASAPGNKAKTAPESKPVGDFGFDTGLPADIKAKLDVGAPGLKGMLRITPEGNSLTVDFNADRWHGGGTALKRILTNALSPTYVVKNPVGYMNPDWTFNY